jgi:hypothetical protein
MCECLTSLRRAISNRDIKLWISGKHDENLMCPMSTCCFSMLLEVINGVVSKCWKYNERETWFISISLSESGKWDTLQKHVSYALYRYHCSYMFGHMQFWRYISYKCVSKYLIYYIINLRQISLFTNNVDKDKLFISDHFLFPAYDL